MPNTTITADPTWTVIERRGAGFRAECSSGLLVTVQVGTVPAGRLVTPRPNVTATFHGPIAVATTGALLAAAVRATINLLQEATATIVEADATGLDVVFDRADNRSVTLEGEDALLVVATHLGLDGEIA